MNQHGLYDLLQGGVPDPPPDLTTPPLAKIRRRARRRRLATGVGTAAALLIVAGIGVQVVKAVQPALPGGGAPASAGPWIFAVVGTDDRSVVVVREGRTAGEACPGTSPEGEMPLPATVAQQPDRVVLPMPALAGHADCFYRMPVRLDAPLGGRALVSGADNTVLPALPERILPRPTYPVGVSRDTAVGPVVGNAPRPVWIARYRSAGGPAITVAAVPADMAPTVPPGEQLQAHGHDMQIQSLAPGLDNVVSWADGDWQVSVTVEADNHGDVSRAELQRIIGDWPGPDRRANSGLAS